MRIDLYANWSDVIQYSATDLPEDQPRDAIVQTARALLADHPHTGTAAVRADNSAPRLFVYSDGRVRDAIL